MNIGNIVSTVQAEPLDETYDIAPLNEEDLGKYKILVGKNEITQEMLDDLFANEKVGV